MNTVYQVQAKGTYPKEQDRGWFVMHHPLMKDKLIADCFETLEQAKIGLESAKAFHDRMKKAGCTYGYPYQYRIAKIMYEVEYLDGSETDSKEEQDSSWETRGIFGYAEKWWTDNGYDWRLKKKIRSRCIYTISKDGMTDEFEITPNVVDFKKFMELFKYTWDLGKRIKAKEA